MEVKVNYQGILAKKAGTISEAISVSGSSSQMRDTITGMHPSIKELSFVVAINGIISHGETEIKAGDNITLIPPAPGG